MRLDPLVLAAGAGYHPTDARMLASRAGRIVARVDTEIGPIVLKADVTSGAFEAEVAAISRLAAAGLRVPQVLAHIPSAVEVLVLSWTEGTALTSRSALQAQHDAGRVLRRIHGLGAKPPYSGQPTVDAWIAEWLDGIVEWWRADGGGTREQEAQLRRWHRTLRRLLAGRGGDLILFDGRPEHILVDDTRVLGLIDLHDLGSGDAAMDLAVIHLADPLLTAGVMAGYQPSPDELSAFEALVPFYTVLRALAGAHWHLQHNSATVMSLLARAARELSQRGVRFS